MTGDEEYYVARGPGATIRTAGYSTSATSLNYGVNVQGNAAGVYAESVDRDTGRTHSFDGTGVEGVGKTVGVAGHTAGSSSGLQIAGVLGVNQVHSGVIGITLGEDSAGVVGVSSITLNPGGGTPASISAERGRGTGVHGASGSGAGVRGVAGTGVGVAAYSARGTAVDAHSGPGPAASFSTQSLAPVVRLAPGVGDLPATGVGGDLLTRIEGDGSVALWLCTHGATDAVSATWRRVQLVPTPAAVPETELVLRRIGWPGRVVSHTGALSPQYGPANAVGRPDGTSFVLPAYDGASATYGDFVDEPLRDIRAMLNADTASFTFPVTAQAIERVQVIAFERNGNAAPPGGAWESCAWRFGDGSRNVEVLWDGRPGAAVDPHVVAAGHISGETYVNHFSVVAATPDAGYRPDEVVSFLCFELAELELTSPRLTVTVRGTSATGEGHLATPDIDAIGVITG